jgi:IS30 family transposase
VARRGHGDQGRRLSDADKAELEERIAAGETQEGVARSIGCDVRTVIRWIMRNGGLRGYERTRSPLRLSPEEREQIAVGIAVGESGSAIGRRLGRATSTITREIAANGGRTSYQACRADRRALHQARRPKTAKLASCHRLRVEVESQLGQRWSPEQISARLRVDFPDDPEMRVSHETIYQSLYVQSRGALRRELTSAVTGNVGGGRVHH